MDEKLRQKYDHWAKETIAKELTPQGDLLPPWKKYPEIPRNSIGWRMGYGESYMIAWDKWVEPMELEQLVEYFRKYSPIPVDWLDWTAYRCGYSEMVDDMISGNGDFTGIHWLEQQGLANFSEFKSWYDENWRIQRGQYR